MFYVKKNSYIVTNWIFNSFGRETVLFLFYMNMNTLLALVNNKGSG